jgi:hypothetical protein
MKRGCRRIIEEKRSRLRKRTGNIRKGMKQE